MKKQVKEMSDDDLDLELGILMGWIDEEHPEWDVPIFRKPDGSFIRALGWRPTSDPAASLEVQAKALDFDCREYIRNLTIRTLGDAAKDIAFDTALYSVKYLGLKRLLTASPRERAEAAWITLSSLRECSDDKPI